VKPDLLKRLQSLFCSELTRTRRRKSRSPWLIGGGDRSLEAEFAGWGIPAQTGVVAICLIGVFLCSGGDERAFIYFQF